MTIAHRFQLPIYEYVTDEVGALLEEHGFGMSHYDSASKTNGYAKFAKLRYGSHDYDQGDIFWFAS